MIKNLETSDIRLSFVTFIFFYLIHLTDSELDFSKYDTCFYLETVRVINR